MPTEEEILEFSAKIEKHSKQYNLSMMESIIDFCEKNEIEIETASSLISQNLKMKVREEAEELNLISRANTLPL